MKKTSLIAAAALLLCGAAQAQNLIVNGDFEDNNVPSGGWLYAPITVWGNAPVAANGWSFAANTGTGIISNDNSGWAWAGMAWFSSVAFLQDHPLFNGAAPVLAQQFTSNGTSYRVEFDLGQRWNNQQDVIVTLDGVALSQPLVPVADFGSTHYSFDISGLSGNLHTLSFTSAFSAGDQTAFVDNVSVVATAFANAPVPEPASAALLAAGLAAVGLMRRRMPRV